MNDKESLLRILETIISAIDAGHQDCASVAEVAAAAAGGKLIPFLRERFKGKGLAYDPLNQDDGAKFDYLDNKFGADFVGFHGRSSKYGSSEKGLCTAATTFLILVQNLRT